MNETANTGAFGWDDEVEPGSQFELIPEGVATFEVLRFKRDRRECGKYGTCNVAVLELLVTPDGEEKTYKHSEDLILHRDLQWLLYRFFTAIGQRHHGDEGPFVPNWGQVEGALGSCEVEYRPFKKKDGTEGQANRINWLTEEPGSKGGGFDF